MEALVYFNPGVKNSGVGQGRGNPSNIAVFKGFLSGLTMFLDHAILITQEGFSIEHHVLSELILLTRCKALHYCSVLIITYLKFYRMLSSERLCLPPFICQNIIPKLMVLGDGIYGRSHSTLLNEASECLYKAVLESSLAFSVMGGH